MHLHPENLQRLFGEIAALHAKVDAMRLEMLRGGARQASVASVEVIRALAWAFGPREWIGAEILTAAMGDTPAGRLLALRFGGRTVQQVGCLVRELVGVTTDEGLFIVRAGIARDAVIWRVCGFETPIPARD